MAPRTLEGVMFNGRLGKILTQTVGKPESLRFRLARDTLGVMVIRGGSMGLNFLIGVFLARWLGAAGYGIYAYVWSVIMFLSIPATFGLPQLLVRNIAAYQVKEKWGHLKGLFYFADRVVLAASIGLMALLGLGIWFFSARMSPQAVTTFLTALPLLMMIALLKIKQMSLQGLNRIVQGEMLESLMRPIFFILLVTGVYFLKGKITPSLVMGMQVIAFGIAFLVGMAMLKGYLLQPIREATPAFEKHAWVRSAIPLFFVGILGMIVHHTDILMLGAIKGAGAVGVYKVAFQVASLISFGLFSMSIAIRPVVSSLYTWGKREQLQRVITRGTGLSVVFALPLVLSFVLAGHWILDVIFGKEFIRGAVPLAVLSVGQLISVVMGPVDVVLIMTGHERDVTKGLGIAAVCNVVLNAFFIPLWGVEGAAIATTASIVLLNTVLAIWVYRKIKIAPTVFGEALFRIGGSKV